jgi:hypothetical protein
MNQAFLRPPLPLFRVAAFATLPLFAWLGYTVALHRLGPLQRLYWSDYVTTTIPSVSMPSLPFGAAKLPRREYQVLACTGSKDIPVTVRMVGVPAGSIHLAAVPMTRSEYHPWLARNIYGGRPAIGFLLVPLTVSFLGVALLAGVGWRLDQLRHLEFRSKGRHLDGPELVTPREFNRRVKGDGIGLRLDRGRWRRPGVLRIERKLETQHQLFQGDTGAGKTVAIMGLVDQFEALGDACVIYDPHREFLRRYYNAERGDVILGPDARCAYWDPSDEIDYSTTANADATAMAQASSLYPGHPGQRDWFFTNSARLIFQHVLTNYQPDAAQMAELMTHADPLIDAIAKGTELEEMLRKNTEGLRASIISTLTQCLFALRQVPEPSPDRPVWAAREWAKTRRGWVFLTSTQDTRDAFASMQRLWIDSIIRNVLTLGDQPKLPQLRMILDELPTLGELSNLKSAITEGRKSGLDLVMGFQGRGLVEEIYGKEAEGLFSAPYFKFLLRTGEPKSGDWASEMIGEEELERIREHRAPDGQRSYTTEQRVERIAPLSNLAALKNLTGFVRYSNFVVKAKVALVPARPDRTVGFVARTGVPPVTLPMPNLAAIREKEAEEKAAKAAKQAAAVYSPPSSAPRGRKTKDEATGNLFTKENN